MKLLKDIPSQQERKGLFILLAVFCIVQTLLFLKFGVVTQNEAAKYVSEGTLLATEGRLSHIKYFFYIPVISLVWLCKSLHISLFFAVLIQVILSGIAQYCFYKLCRSLTNYKAAFITSLFLALFFPLQSWNFHLYSDSILISLSLVYLWFFYQYDRYQLTRHLLLALAVLVLITFSRPHGLLFIPPAILYLVFRKQSRKNLFINMGICVLLTGLMFLAALVIFSGGGDMDAMKPFIEEHIICFVPTATGDNNLTLINSGSQMYDLWYYIIHNPLHFLKLTGLKILSFFNLTRPWYTPVNNYLLIALMVPLYTSFLFGLKKFIQANRRFALLVIGLLLLYPFGMTLQCDDWHSRFTMAIIGALLCISCYRVNWVVEKIKR
ncbi:glycosyltransferase family 39 protein [Terrimonas rubra]|uniref:Glycosyltransferase family 39 protein n=1 Tax=Terrimonas rubra TaxID=1035890 RepID=A0ABW6A5E9_9BACT